MKTTSHNAAEVITSVGGHSVGSFAIAWVHVRKPAKRESLAALNRRLFNDPEQLLKIAEANTRQLTGKSRF